MRVRYFFGAILILLATFWAGAGTARADSISFSVGNGAATGMGNIGGNPFYDALFLTGHSGTLDLSPGASATIWLSDFDFQVGFTGADSAGPHKGTITYLVTLDGVTHVVNQPYVLDVGYYTDTLTLLPVDEMFTLGPSRQVLLQVDPLGPITSGDRSTGGVEGVFSLDPVPEAGTLVLLGLGLLGIGAVLKRHSASEGEAPAQRV